MQQTDEIERNEQHQIIRSVYSQLTEVLNRFRLRLGGGEDLGTVYHFTRVPILQHMFIDEVARITGDTDSMALRATCLSEMNDPMEISLGLDLIDEVVQGMVGASHWINEAIGHAREPQNKEAAFAFCTARSVADLPCWIAYADHGRGIAIGLKSSVLQQNYGMKALPICYDESNFRSLLGDILPAVDETFKRFDEIHGPHLVGLTPWVQAIRTLTLIAACFKSNTYSHEKEVRFVHWPSDAILGIQTDLTASRPTRFIGIAVQGSLALQSIVVGSNAPTSTISAVETFLANRRVTGVHVTASGLQYRV